jgi:uncharacterized repeat protein (TIGR03803 family)
VFKITPTGEETVLHLFAAAPADGWNPEVVIQGNDGNFYGTTSLGGAHNGGTVFKLTPEGVETIPYSFAGVCSYIPSEERCLTVSCPVASWSKEMMATFMA